MTEEALERLVSLFLDRSLPAEEWTHQAHLLVGLMLGRRLPQDRLLPTLRRTISAYNVATGGQNTDEAGYHETITAFYAATLGAFARATQDLPAAHAAERLLNCPLADRRIVLRAYSDHTLKSKAARLTCVPPDHADFSADRLAQECLAGAD